MAESKTPSFVLRQLSAGATVDEALESRILALCEKLPGTLGRINELLRKGMFVASYDSATNLAMTHIWSRLQEIAGADPDELIRFARTHMTDRAKTRAMRILAKHSKFRVRRKIDALLQKNPVHEVALPHVTKDKTGNWDATGWLHGTEAGRIKRHKAGTRVQARHGLPKITNVLGIRKLLGIQSQKQLGFLLWSTDRPDPYSRKKKQPNAPYHKFTIPKRDGSERTICAPTTFLR